MNLLFSHQGCIKCQSHPGWIRGLACVLCRVSQMGECRSMLLMKAADGIHGIHLSLRTLIYLKLKSVWLPLPRIYITLLYFTFLFFPHGVYLIIHETYTLALVHFQPISLDSHLFIFHSSTFISPPSHSPLSLFLSFLHSPQGTSHASLG